ncbi:MAG: membrane dipeptidase, partial [Flavobacteriaceae bacterium]
MEKNRRNLTKLLSLGLVFPSQVAYSLSSIFESIDSDTDFNSLKTMTSELQEKKIEKLYNKATVIDGLIISRNWNEDSFKALAASGYSGFNASVDSGDLTKCISNLNNWQTRIKENENKLILAKSAADFKKARKENKTAIMLGFQNSSMIGKSIKNIDKLYNAGLRWMQLTYNSRNLIGDGSTERTNCGLSDFGIEVVNHMNERGIIIDLSHCGEQTTYDGIAFSKLPVSINHSMCEALHKNHPRAKTDGQIKAMADKGGII